VMRITGAVLVELAGQWQAASWLLVGQLLSCRVQCNTTVSSLRASKTLWSMHLWSKQHVNLVIVICRFDATWLSQAARRMLNHSKCNIACYPLHLPRACCAWGCRQHAKHSGLHTSWMHLGGIALIAGCGQANIASTAIPPIR
jgi:hypothetical protein